MNIIIVGCGKAGTAIISALVNEGHDVVAVDDNPQAVAEITNVYDAMTVTGSGTDCDTLREAGVENAELVVSVTDSDELNMLCCYIARKMGARHTIARIRNPEYNDDSLGFLKENLNLSIAVNPEKLTALELFNILKLPSAVKVETFSRRNFEMAEIILKPDSPLCGMTLQELRTKYNKVKFLVCVVGRGDEVHIPYGSFVLQGGDKIGITASPLEMQKLLSMLGLASKQARNVMILGASRTAYYLAKLLLDDGSSVKIIEKDEKRCQEICDELHNAVVINGNGAHQELLLEEGINSSDAFVSLTGIDEINILISIFALSQNVGKVIAKVNHEELSAMAEKLGLDCTVSAQDIITDIVVRYSRALQNSIGSKVEVLYKLMDGKAEALEFNVLDDFGYLQVKLRDMKLKPNTLIAGILRGKTRIIPSGDDVIMAGDKVIVIAAGQKIRDLSDIIK